MRTKNNSTSKALWTAREVKPLLRYNSTSAFWAFVHSSGLPHIRINERRTVFSPAAVEAWLRERAVGDHESPIVSHDEI